VVRSVVGTDVAATGPGDASPTQITPTTATTEAVMQHAIETIIVPVRDLAVAKALYGTALAAEPYADAPYYVGFRIGDQEIGLDPNGHNHGMTGPVAYCNVDDVAASLQQAVDAGWTTRQDVKDVGGGRLAAIVEDPDGNILGFLQSR
jgi:predicted enzyme related to lactoylglutathione lyase